MKFYGSKLALVFLLVWYHLSLYLQITDVHYKHRGKYVLNICILTLTGFQLASVITLLFCQRMYSPVFFYYYTFPSQNI